MSWTTHCRATAHIDSAAMYELMHVSMVVELSHKHPTQHKTMLISAQLVINPIILPLLMPLPLYLHCPLEIANIVVLVLSALSPHGLCAQLRAQLALNDLKGDALANGTTTPTPIPLGDNTLRLAGWLQGELADDWPVCISLSTAMDQVLRHSSVQHHCHRPPAQAHALVHPFVPPHLQSYCSSCAALCLLVIVLGAVPVSFAVYLLELRLRYRFYTRTHRQAVVPSLPSLLCQQGMQLFGGFLVVYSVVYSSV